MVCAVAVCICAHKSGTGACTPDFWYKLIRSEHPPPPQFGVNVVYKGVGTYSDSEFYGTFQQLLHSGFFTASVGVELRCRSDRKSVGDHTAKSHPTIERDLVC